MSPQPGFKGNHQSRREVTAEGLWTPEEGEAAGGGLRTLQ